MKKWLAMILMLVLVLTGCKKEEKIVVDELNRTISQGNTTYTYTDTTEGDTRTIIIHYPNGGVYTWTKTGNETHGQGSNMPHVANGQVLVHAVLNPNQPEEPWWPSCLLIIVGISVAVLGFLQVLYPHVIWDKFMRKWYREDVSEYALTRLISKGVGLIILGGGVILLGIFG